MSEDEIARAIRAAEPFTLPGGEPMRARERADLSYNDLGNAKRYRAHAGDKITFVRGAGAHAFVGTHWDRNLGPDRAMILAHQVVEAMGEEAQAVRDDPNVADKEDRIKRTLKGRATAGAVGRMQAMVKVAQPYMSRNIDTVDEDSCLLAARNGTLMLNESPIRLRPSRPEDLITRCCAAAYDPDAEAPAFRAFVDLIQPEPELQTFMQRLLGSALIGENVDQVMGVLVGDGANGKSTLIIAIAEVLGDYAQRLPIESLLHNDRRNGGDPRPDLVRLPGARLVTVSEPEPGARLSESFIKTATGGEPLLVRDLHQGFVEFTPAFTLILSCNRKPRVLGTDEGIWRRLLVLQFTQVISAPRRQSDVLAAFRAEASGILNWLLDGYRCWRERGLDAPECVRKAKDAYRSEQDPLSGFLDMCTVKGDHKECKATELYKAYKGYCLDAAQDPMNQRRFGTMLSDRRFKTKHSNGTWRCGLDLNDTGHEALARYVRLATEQPEDKGSNGSGLSD